jgi:hypothetical protein
MENAVFWDVTTCGSCKNLTRFFLRFLQEPQNGILHSYRRENLKFYENSWDLHSTLWTPAEELSSHMVTEYRRILTEEVKITSQSIANVWNLFHITSMCRRYFFMLLFSGTRATLPYLMLSVHLNVKYILMA